MVEDCSNILKEYGFRFVRRGPIFVKGKGELLTFFMKGKDTPKLNGHSVMTVLPYQVGDHFWSLRLYKISHKTTLSHTGCLPKH